MPPTEISLHGFQLVLFAYANQIGTVLALLLAQWLRAKWQVNHAD